jgi:hypothetical protein
MTAKLNDLMKNSIATAHLDGLTLIISAIGPDNTPVGSFRGSTQSYDDGAALAIWVRKPDTSTLIEAITHNPHIALTYSDMATHRRRIGWIFYGRARIDDDPQVRDTVFNTADEAERSRDPDMTGRAVIIDLDRITGFPL